MSEFKAIDRDVVAAVLREPNGPLRQERVKLEQPRYDEVLVRIVAVGVCHTDASARSGELPIQLPAVLGHEGAGVVEAVGAGVTKVTPGDHVVLTVYSCGLCEGCQHGRPAACDGSFALNFGGARPDGSHALCGCDGEVIQDRFFAQSSFATYSIANQRNVVKVAKDLPLELLGPLGCGIQTGAGSVLNGLKVEAGQSIVIFGTGAVGLSAIMAAKLAAATTIIAVDLVEERLKLAHELGATHVINGRDEQLVEQIQQICGGGGAHYALDTTGNVGVIRKAVLALRTRGVCGILGATGFGVDLSLDTLDLMSRSKTIRGIVEGDSVPDFFIPALLELYRQGQFPFDRLIRRYEFSQIDQAFEDSHSGITVKPVVIMPSAPES